MAGLTIFDFSDREVLFRLGDTLDEHGKVSSHELGRALGLSDEDGRNVGVRLAWMRRFGVIDKAGRDGKRGTLWTLTPLGRNLLDGNLSVAQREQLAAVSDAQRITLMETLAGRARKHDQMRTLLRRSWQNGTGTK